jgi:Sulfotransferase family
MTMTNVAYIASPSYSGSTLLTILMAAHRDIATVGELKWANIDADTYLCSCKRVLNECSFWTAIQSRVHERGLPFNLHRPLTDFRSQTDPIADKIIRARIRGPVFEAVRDTIVTTLPDVRSQWQVIADVNQAVIEETLDLQGGSVFLEASKDPVRLKHLMGTGDYDMRVIHLVRDGRGVTNSAMKNYGFTPDFAALEWLRTHEQVERLAVKLPDDRFIRIRYEDLCQDVHGTLRSLFEFCELDPDGYNQDFSSYEFHVLGNRMRQVELSSIRLDEKWRSMLSSDDLEAFERVAGRLNRKYGYRPVD